MRVVLGLLTIILLGAAAPAASGPPPAQRAMLDLRAINYTPLGAADPGATYTWVAAGKDAYRQVSASDAAAACAPGSACATRTFRIEGRCKIIEVNALAGTPEALRASPSLPLVYGLSLKSLSPAEQGTQPLTLAKFFSVDFSRATAVKLSGNAVQFTGPGVACMGESIESASPALRAKLQAASAKWTSSGYQLSQCFDEFYVEARGQQAYLSRLVATAATSGCFKP